MSRLATRAEIQKLAQLLQLDSGRLDFLEPLPTEVIRRLRENAADQLYSGKQKLFQRLGAASRLLPAALVAFMGRKVFGAMLSARVAGELPPQRAIDMAMKMDVSFLADVSIELEPRRATAIIRGMPPERVRDVGLELLRRRAFITMARFVDHVSDAAMRLALSSIHDAEALLHIGFFVENRARLDQMMDLVTDDQLRAIVKLAQDPAKGYWAEALALMQPVSIERRRRLGEIVAQQSPAELEQVLRMSHAQGLWGELLPVMASLSPESQRKLLQIPGLDEPGVLESIAETAKQQDLVNLLAPLLPSLPPALQQRMLEIGLRLGILDPSWVSSGR